MPETSLDRDEQAARETRAGVLYALGAYLSWGLITIYFKAVDHVPPLEVLAHRIAFSAVLLVAWLALRRQLPRLVAVVRDRRTLLTLLATTLLVGTNWLVFILAVFHDRVVEASLGYFINPLVSVALGATFLGEKLRPRQWAAIALAAAGVGYLTFAVGRPPVLALILASTFGLYGLLRKTVRADATVGLTVETLMLLPLALGYLLVLGARGGLVLGHTDWQTNVLLPLGGVVTAVPLLWFANAVRRLRLATVGILQYLAPSGQLLLGVLAFGEPFTRAHAVTFGCIWSALVIYSLDAFGARVRRAPAVP